MNHDRYACISWIVRVLPIGLLGGGTVGWISMPAIAQITPDSTLGDESSVLTEGASVRGAIADLIKGGAVRDANLFHSFLEFNVRDGQRVYFANPDTIANIFSRVTGNDPSEILGTLGVDGSANLFFLNPNGILFGENASLDIDGSFVGSTAETLLFRDGTQFSAINPDPASMLTVSVPLGLQHGPTPPGSTIINRGTLAPGQDLTLRADGLNLQGQVLAGGDVTLHADDTLQIRDAVDAPFLAVSGGDMLVQGDRQVDIFALNHPHSGLFSGGDMTLRSARPVGGDAHYWSGGTFRTEHIDGNLGTLYSPYDPVIRALGNIQLNEYVGTSLHILAGGSVTILGSITITDADATGTTINPSATPNLATVTLSDGTPLTIDGTNQPTLDIRAGLDPAVIGEPLTLVGNNFAFINGTFDDTPVSSAITVGNVFVTAPNGLVYLTNQFAPNEALPDSPIQIQGSGVLRTGILASGFGGDGGQVVLDARGDISLGRSATFQFPSIDVSSDIGAGGQVILLSDADISLSDGSVVNVRGADQGSIDIRARNVNVLGGSRLLAGIAPDLGAEGSQAGDIVISASDTVTLAGPGRSSIENNVGNGGFGNPSTTLGDGGNILISADTVAMSDAAFISTETFGTGHAGDILIQADRSVRLEGVGDTQFNTLLLSRTQGGAIGDSGDIRVETATFSMTENSQISTSTEARGNSGTVRLDVSESVTLDNSNIFTEVSDGELRGDANAIGNGGDIIIEAGSVLLDNGAQLRADTENRGDAGNIVVASDSSVTLRGRGTAAGPFTNIVSSGISSTVEEAAVGSGGTIQVVADSLRLEDGAFLDTATLNEGRAGSIDVRVAGNVTFDGQILDEGGQSLDGRPSGAFSGVGQAATGDGGTIEIHAESLNLTNRAQISASTSGQGNSGNVRLTVGDDITFTNSTLFTEVSAEGGVGDGGDVFISTGSLILRDGSQLRADTENQGDGGDVTIDAQEIVLLEGQGPSILDRNVLVPSGIFSAVEETANGRGGDIRIGARAIIFDDAEISAETRGEGRAGTISLAADERISSNRSIIRTAVNAGAEGNGGDIFIQAGTIEFDNRTQVTSSTAGAGNTGQIGMTATRAVELSNASEVTSEVLGSAVGNAQRITVQTPRLSLVENAQISAATFGTGNAGTINIQDATTVTLDNSTLSTAVTAETAIAPDPSNITINTQTLRLTNGADITASTAGQGDAGTITVENAEALSLAGSAIASEVLPTGQGQGGTLNLMADSLSLTNRSRITASTEGRGRAGDIFITGTAVTGDRASQIRTITSRNQDAGDITIVADSTVALEGADTGIFASTEPDSRGNGGNIAVHTRHLSVTDRAEISSESLGEGTAGNVEIQADDTLLLETGRVATSADASAGGAIEILAGEIFLSGTSDITTNVDSGADRGGNITIRADGLQLRDDSDITTNVSGGTGDGGNIAIAADFIIAFDDSDIISSAPQGQGGNITLNTTGFFGEGFSVDSFEADPIGLDGNDRVDINATGAVTGTITLPDVSFIQNSLNDLPEGVINTESLIANSCVVRNEDGSSTFIITGAGGLPNRPGDGNTATFPTGDVQAIPDGEPQSWHPGDPIVEAEGVYQLPNGSLVISHFCNR